MNMALTTLKRGGSTVKWHDEENAIPRRKGEQENEPGQEGGWEGEPQYRSNNNRDIRLKEKQTRPAYWV
jgi:hypothetical protein